MWLAHSSSQSNAESEKRAQVGGRVWQAGRQAGRQGAAEKPVAIAVTCSGDVEGRLNSVLIHMDLNLDDTDESDWGKAGQLAQNLKHLEVLLRCPICRQFLDTPVVLKCGHHFCSSCARENLTQAGSKGVCPVCRKSANVGDITSSPTLDEIIQTFRTVRPSLLSLVLSTNGIGTGSSQVLKAAPVAAAPAEAVQARPLLRHAAQGDTKASTAQMSTRIMNPSWSQMKDEEIKTLLRSKGLRVEKRERKDVWINRYTRFVNAFRVEVDAGRIPNDRSIADKVHSEEDRRRKLEMEAKRNTPANLAKVTSDRELPPKMKENFRDLIAQCRKRDAIRGGSITKGAPDIQDTATSGPEGKVIGSEDASSDVTPNLEPPWSTTRDQKRGPSPHPTISADASGAVDCSSTPSSRLKVSKSATTCQSDVTQSTRDCDDGKIGPPQDGALRITKRSMGIADGSKEVIDVTDDSLETASLGASSTSSSRCWGCPACTLENDAGASTCILCGAKNPSRKGFSLPSRWSSGKHSSSSTKRRDSADITAFAKPVASSQKKSRT